LQQAEAQRRLPKIVVPVHFSGLPADQEAIWELAQQYGFRVLEDASHAIGAVRNGESVGSCRWSDITVFSFHPVKIITTGEGGMALTKDRRLAEAMAMLRSHGITRDAGAMTEKNPGPWYYEQLELGYNYRMTDIQAALGASQLARLDTFVTRRRELAARYDTLLAGLPLQLPARDDRAQSSWHLYVVRLRLDRIGRSHRQVFEALRAAGIGVNLHYIPVHLQPYYRALGFAAGHCPEAERYGGEAISLPLYPALSEAEQDYIATTLRELLA
jgi:dTDP-4-amino-4,6-dideoxygalactose transaminase